MIIEELKKIDLLQRKINAINSLNSITNNSCGPFFSKKWIMENIFNTNKAMRMLKIKEIYG